MLHNEYVRNMFLLLIAACVVLGLFFIQHQNILSKSTPQPTPTPFIAASGNIIVSAPTKEASVPTDFLVRGKARVFENVVSIRVSSTVFGKVYYQGPTYTNAADAGQFGEFTARIHLTSNDNSLRPNDKLTLEVFQLSAKDGSEIDKVTIPLIFSPQLP